MFKASRLSNSFVAAATAFIVAFPLSGAARADALDEYVLSEMETRQLPGLSLVAIKSGEIVEIRSYGFANLETKTPVTPQTAFAIGSITKSMTAIAVMKLVESGAVTLDDAIGAHVEGLPKRWRPLTIRQLMSNTSGVPADLDNPCRHKWPPASPGAPSYSRADFFAEVSCLPLLDPPGSAFHYSDFNFQMLGLLIEKITEKTYAAALDDFIFAPLGMSATRLLDYQSLIDMRADGYELREGSYFNSAPMDPIIEYSSGGILSTAADMAKFLAALGGPLLRPDSWDALWSKPLSVVGQTPYALGFGVTPYKGIRRVGHNGSAVGFASSFSLFPDNSAGVVVLANSYQAPLGRNLQDFANEIALKADVIAPE